MHNYINIHILVCAGDIRPPPLTASTPRISSDGGASTFNNDNSNNNIYPYYAYH